MENSYARAVSVLDTLRFARLHRLRRGITSQRLNARLLVNTDRVNPFDRQANPERVWRVSLGAGRDRFVAIVGVGLPSVFAIC